MNSCSKFRISGQVLQKNG